MIAAGVLRGLHLEIGEGNRLPVLVGVVAFFVAIGLLVFAVFRPEDEGSREAQRTPASFESRAVINGKGDYRLRAPVSWKADRRGIVTTLTSSKRDVVVTILPGARRNLADAAKVLFDSIAGAYSKVSFMGATEQLVGNRRAVVFSGKATNDAGVRLRFLGATFSEHGRRFATTVFTTERSSPKRVLPRIELIVNSVRSTR